MNIENFIQQYGVKIEGLIAKLTETLPGLSGGFISTVDGHPVAHFSSSGDDPSRISAMCASLFALSESLIKELRGGDCQHIAIQTSSGPVVLVRIPSDTHTLVISAAANAKTPLGSLLSWVNETGNSIAASIG